MWVDVRCVSQKPEPNDNDEHMFNAMLEWHCTNLEHSFTFFEASLTLTLLAFGMAYEVSQVSTSLKCTQRLLRLSANCIERSTRLLQRSRS